MTMALRANADPLTVSQAHQNMESARTTRDAANEAFETAAEEAIDELGELDYYELNGGYELNPEDTFYRSELNNHRTFLDFQLDLSVEDLKNYNFFTNSPGQGTHGEDEYRHTESLFEEYGSHYRFLEEHAPEVLEKFTNLEELQQDIYDADNDYETAAEEGFNTAVVHFSNEDNWDKVGDNNDSVGLSIFGSDPHNENGDHGLAASLLTEEANSDRLEDLDVAGDWWWSSQDDKFGHGNFESYVEDHDLQ